MVDLARTYPDIAAGVITVIIVIGIVFIYFKLNNKE